MRPWRNRQTRTFEGRVGDRTGSSPVGRTKFDSGFFGIPSFFVQICFKIRIIQLLCLVKNFDYRYNDII